MTGSDLVVSDTREFDDEETWHRHVSHRVGLGHRFAGLFAVPAGDAEDHDSTCLVATVAVPGGLELIETTVGGRYPSLTPTVSAAFWYERAIHDLFGVIPMGHPRLDPLILPLADHTHRKPRPGSAVRSPRLTPDEAELPRRVHGAGLFTIPHGPVRSGVMESVEYLVETPGEGIPRLQLRIFAKHRGVAAEFSSRHVDDGVLLAERAEGIASVAHALAYCHALERAADVDVPSAAKLLRLLHAELERIAHHLDVIVRLADAAGLAVAVARFSWHKERIMRVRGHLCGSRFGRGVVVPGGVSKPLHIEPESFEALLRPIEDDVNSDCARLLTTSSFLDRLRGTGPLPPERAREHGVLGPLARASGYDDDCRSSRPYDGYVAIEVPSAVATSGDVQARLEVLVQETQTAFTLCHVACVELARRSSLSGLRNAVPVTTGRFVGWAEAPHGEVTYVVETIGDRIRWCAPRSPSFHNLAIFHDVFRGDVLTDFPFIEASFGLSIAGAVL